MGNYQPAGLQDGPSVEKDIYIDQPRPVNLGRPASHGRFDALAQVKQSKGIEVGLPLASQVEKIGLIPESHRLRFVNRRTSRNCQSPTIQLAQCASKVAHPISEVRTHGEIDGVRDGHGLNFFLR